jgi:hypothetical protein
VSWKHSSLKRHIHNLVEFLYIHSICPATEIPIEITKRFSKNLILKNYNKLGQYKNKNWLKSGMNNRDLT